MVDCIQPISSKLLNDIVHYLKFNNEPPASVNKKYFRMHSDVLSKSIAKEIKSLLGVDINVTYSDAEGIVDKHTQNEEDLYFESSLSAPRVKEEREDTMHMQCGIKPPNKKSGGDVKTVGQTRLASSMIKKIGVDVAEKLDKKIKLYAQRYHTDGVDVTICYEHESHLKCSTVFLNYDLINPYQYEHTLSYVTEEVFKVITTL